MAICTLQKVFASDLPALVAISRQTFTETFAPHNTEADMEAYCNNAFKPAQLAEELSNPNSAFYFGVEAGIPVGYLKINFGAAQTEPLDAAAVEVERIYVRQAHQGKGVGHLLLHNALSIARQRKAPFVWLGVWEHNQKAIAFYRKYGFTVFGSHPFRLGNDLQTDLLLRRRLAPEQGSMP